MLSTLNAILNIQVSSFANRLIYYLQKLPLVGRLIGDDTYSRLGWKRTAAIIVTVMFVLLGFLSHLLYVGLVVYLPIVYFGSDLSSEQQLSLFWHQLFILSFVVAGVSSARILEPKRSKYIAIKLMRLSATRYMKVTMSYRYVAFFIQMLPAMLLCSYWLGSSLLYGIVVTAAIVLWRIFCEYVHLILYRRTGMILIKHMVIVWLVIIAGYAAAFGPLFSDVVPLFGATILRSIPFLVACFVLGISCGTLLLLRTDYRDAVDASTRRDDPMLDLGRMMAEARNSSVAAKDSDYRTEDVANVRTTYQDLEGYAYMHAIFFSRHRSLIRQPFTKRLMIVSAIGAGLMILGVLYQEQATLVTSNIGAMLPILLFAMSFLTVGEHLCKALFYHCDLKLLRYSFYRQDAAKHYRIRLRKMLSMNMTIGILLAAVLTLVAIASDSFSLQPILLLWICIVSLAVFFTVHSLFLYYIFQPYTVELNAKNPFFILFSWLTSVAFVATVYLRPEPIVFTAIVFTVSLTYLALSLVLVKKFGPHTFRVK